MKKLSMIEAANVVGGTKTCAAKFEWYVVNNKVTCRQIQICTEKDGKETTTMGVDAPGRCNPF